MELCHIVFPGAEGYFTVTPSGNVIPSCRYPGPAQGGGVDTVFGVCFMTPAGNINCTCGRLPLYLPSGCDRITHTRSRRAPPDADQPR